MQNSSGLGKLQISVMMHERRSTSLRFYPPQEISSSGCAGRGSYVCAIESSSISFFKKNCSMRKSMVIRSKVEGPGYAADSPSALEGDRENVWKLSRLSWLHEPK